MKERKKRYQLMQAQLMMYSLYENIGPNQNKGKVFENTDHPERMLTRFKGINTADC